MFCPKCGKQVAEGARFCPACGNRLATPVDPAAPASEAAERPGVPSPAPAPVIPPRYAAPRPGAAPQPGPAVAKGAGGSSLGLVKMLAVADIALLLATLLPWISIDLYIYDSWEFSLLDVFAMLFNVNDAAAGLLGSSYSQSDLSSVLMLVFCVIGLLWLATVLSLAYDAYVRISGKKKASPAAFAMSIACVVLVIGCCFFLDMAVGEGMRSFMGSGGLSGVVTPTFWAWLYLVASIACVIVQSSARKAHRASA